MNCTVCEELLQGHLDGDIPLEHLEHHLQNCSLCESARPAILRLLAGVALLQPPSPSATLPQRIKLAVTREALVRKQRRRWQVSLRATLAIAAALVILVVGWLWPGKDSQPVEPPSGDLVQQEPSPQPAIVPLRASVAEAGNAAVSLTARTASVLPSSFSWPWLDSADLPELLMPEQDSLPVSPMLESTLQPLQDAGASVQAGLAPVTDSARRAFSLLLRDLPVSRSLAAHKPG